MSEITFSEAAELLPMYGRDLKVKVSVSGEPAIQARASNADFRVFDAEDEVDIYAESQTWSCKIRSAEVKRCVLEEGRLTFDCGDHSYEVEQA